MTCYNSTVTFNIQALNTSCDYYEKLISANYYTEREFYDKMDEKIPIYSIHSLKVKEKYNTCTIYKPKNRNIELSTALILNMLGYLLTVGIFFGYIY